jgi:hypothetical protein
MARSALVARADLGKKTDLEIARSMLKRGMDKQQVLMIFDGNREVEDKL